MNRVSASILSTYLSDNTAAKRPKKELKNKVAPTESLVGPRFTYWGAKYRGRRTVFEKLSSFANVFVMIYSVIYIQDNHQILTKSASQKSLKSWMCIWATFVYEKADALKGFLCMENLSGARKKKDLE